MRLPSFSDTLPTSTRKNYDDKNGGNTMRDFYSANRYENNGINFANQDKQEADMSAVEVDTQRYRNSDLKYSS